MVERATGIVQVVLSAYKYTFKVILENQTLFLVIALLLGFPPLISGKLVIQENKTRKIIICHCEFHCASLTNDTMTQMYRVSSHSVDSSLFGIFYSLRQSEGHASLTTLKIFHWSASFYSPSWGKGWCLWYLKELSRTQAWLPWALISLSKRVSLTDRATSSTWFAKLVKTVENHNKRHLCFGIWYTSKDIIM